MPKINSLLKFVLYADDANIIINGKTVMEVIEKLVRLSSVLIHWVDSNGLALNLKKTCYMLFTSRSVGTIPEIYIAGKKIERKTESRFLGVIVDDKLSWSKHISAVKSKMMRYVGVMYKIKRHLPIEARLQIYQSFVQSHLNYCSIVWGFAAKSHIESLFSRQKQGIRAVMPGFVNYFYKDGILPNNTKSFFSERKILTVHSIIMKNALTLLHKIKHFPKSVPRNVILTFPENIPTVYSDHVTAKLWLEYYNTTYFRSSIFYKGPLLSIYADNANIRTLPTLLSLKSFKNAANQMLLNLQDNGSVETWPSFLLHNIPGLRRSPRLEHR